MTSTLASSLIGIAPLRMLLFKNIGSVGGTGRVLCTADARLYLLDDSGASRSSKNDGIVRWYVAVSAALRAPGGVGVVVGRAEGVCGCFVVEGAPGA